MKRLDDIFIGSMFLSWILMFIAMMSRVTINPTIPRFCPKGWCKEYETSKVLKCTRCIPWNNDTLTINK